MCVLISLGALACCCLGTTPPDSAEDLDITGTWRAEYDEEFEGSVCWVTGVETLTLWADGTYQQVYDNGYGYVYTSPRNEWHRQYNRVHLAQGRFYPLGIKDAEKLADGRLIWHTNDDGTGQPLKLNSTTGITLYITHHWYIFENEREVTLDYPPACEPDSPVVVYFRRVVTPVLSTSSPSE